MNTAVGSELVSVQNLTRQFDSVAALEDVCLSVSRGERVALLGHNGAGKTTLFRLMLGFLLPDAGSVSINGHAPGSPEARPLVSYLPENVRFVHNLTGQEVLKLYATLKGASRSDCSRVLEQVGLAHAAKLRVGTYSKGMRQRLGLAQALLGRPALLLLDEPTSGLDPLSRQDFYALADAVAKNGSAVLQSSHSLTELEARTDRIAILQQGRLVANASLEVLQMSAALAVEIRVTAKPDKARQLLRQLSGSTMDAGVIVTSCQLSDKAERLRQLWAMDELVADITVHTPRLDDIYRFYCKRADSVADSLKSHAPGPEAMRLAAHRSSTPLTVSVRGVDN